MTQDHTPPATQFHGWLLRHKIIFETVVGFVFLCASVFISVLQWRSAELQRITTERENEPAFSIHLRAGKAEGVNGFADAGLEVVNAGGPALEFRVKLANWAFVSLIGEKTPSRQNLLVPLKGYFSEIPGSDGTGKGVVKQFVGKRSQQTWAELEQATRALANSRECYLGMQLRTYAAISYTDIFNKHQTRYYLIDPNIGSVQIRAAEGRRYVDEALASSDTLTLGKITPEQLLELAIKRPLE